MKREKEKREIKQDKSGITLIALVITIINALRALKVRIQEIIRLKIEDIPQSSLYKYFKNAYYNKKNARYYIPNILFNIRN